MFKVVIVSGTSRTSTEMFNQLKELLPADHFIVKKHIRHRTPKPNAYTVSYDGVPESEVLLDRPEHRPYLRDVQRVLYDLIGIEEPSAK